MPAASRTSPRSFTATIEGTGRGGGAYVTVPFDVEAVYGSKKPKVVTTFDGVEYRGSLVRMGTDCHLLIILKGIREQIGKEVGDKVKVAVWEDTAPRVVEVPEDFAHALKKSKAARTTFDNCSYTHQKEYVQWINSARREETRERRITQAVAMLEEGRKAR